MPRRVLDHDPVTGVTEYFHTTEKGFAIETVQDVQGTLDANQYDRHFKGEGWKGDMHHVARIPEVVWASWWREFGGNPLSKEHRNKTIARLNNRDWYRLRTKEGRI